MNRIYTVAERSNEAVLRQLARRCVLTGVFIVALSAGVTAQQTSGMGAGGSGTKNIRYPADVAGQMVADLAFRQYPKSPNWNQNLAEVCRIRKESLVAQQQRLEHLLAEGQREPSPQFTPFEHVQAEYGLAELAAYQGNMAAAVKHWEAGLRIATVSIPKGVPQLEAILGAAYFHKAEMEADIYRSPGARDIFPLKAISANDSTADLKTAVQFLEKYLDSKPNALDEKWLLNLAYMYLGQYPAAVPKKYALPMAAFESRQNIGTFTDVAPAAGLNLVTASGGVVVDDFDGDGYPDIVTSSYDVCAPMHFFHNNADGTFGDRSSKAHLSEQLGGLNTIQADYNNDGCMDLLVLRGAWEFPVRKSLLKNNCDGTFTDVTAQAGLAEPATSTQTAAWADINNDGLIDLFVGNENAPSQLFLNKGDGTFEDISHKAGVDRVSFAKAVVASDYDHDGYVDFYVSNLYGNNFLYHNQHNNTFTEVAAAAGVQNPQSSFAAWFFDYDNDGWPDLFVASYSFSLDEAMRSYLGLPYSAERLKLFHNSGNGKFENVTNQLGLDRVFLPMGANFGDIDNDGFLDIYLGNGGPEYGALLQNVLFRNDAGKRFVDITASSGTGDIHKGHGIAFVDFQNDGQEDIVANLGGATPGDAHALRLFKNPANLNDWINLKLIGSKSNRAAIGAEITLTEKTGAGGTRKIYRAVSSGGSFGASPLEQHIGLGKGARIEKLEIFWPASKRRQEFRNVAVNQTIVIRESANRYRRLVRKYIVLGGTQPFLPHGH